MAACCHWSSLLSSNPSTSSPRQRWQGGPHQLLRVLFIILGFQVSQTAGTPCRCNASHANFHLSIFVDHSSGTWLDHFSGSYFAILSNTKTVHLLYCMVDNIEISIRDSWLWSLNFDLYYDWLYQKTILNMHYKILIHRAATEHTFPHLQVQNDSLQNTIYKTTYTVTHPAASSLSPTRAEKPTVVGRRYGSVSPCPRIRSHPLHNKKWKEFIVRMLN